MTGMQLKIKRIQAGLKQYEVASILGMNPNKLVKRMGHGSKKMVYEVYGNYVEGLEKDADKIFGYFGNDFNDL